MLSKTRKSDRQNEPRVTTAVLLATFAGLSGGFLSTSAFAVDATAAPTLQWFEGSYSTMENRTADIFMAGYGNVWTPPPGRADSGNQSVGYDQYNRFDIGSAGNPTLYGTETGLKTFANALDKIGTNLHIDLVWNHCGFSDRGSTNDIGESFANSGGYPGFWLGEGNSDGDFHSPYESGEWEKRISDLVDINQATNHQFVRNPVPGYNNVPGGSGYYYGKKANVPREENRRFYGDTSLPSKTFYEPRTGQTFTYHEFNSENPYAGDPVEENATGYLMRNARWLVEEIGVDGFRIDAAKHFPGWVMDYYDAAVYQANPRKLLDGSTQHVFGYSEVFDGNTDYLNSFIRKDINPNDPGTVGGNRDTLDFALFFAMKDNLNKNGYNNWYNVAYNNMDYADDHQMNGSAGVKFVTSHDEYGATLSNVAHAYMLMMPGNSVVYFNGKEFGDGRNFPKNGRGDALGGVWGNTITTLTNISNTHGRGDYRERWIDNNVFAFERSNASLVVLNNRNDGGTDARTLRVDFAPGSYLVELTGNHANNGDVKEVVQVFQGDDGNSYVNVNSLRNDGGDQGYLVYGLAKPESNNGVELSNVSTVLEGGNDVSNNYANGTKRLADLHVITSDEFDIKLVTNKVFLPGEIRDHNADGDNALFKIDGGLDFNNNNQVDYVTPGSVTYGFENFTDTCQAGYHANNGNGGEGKYVQNIDASKLGEGEHYITIRTFRHRDDGGPAIYEDFKKVIYVDRLPPESTVTAFESITGNVSNHHKVSLKSIDKTADNMHVFMDLAAGLSDSDIIGMLGNSSQTDRKDRDIWEKEFYNLGTGNHTITIVTYEQTGNVNVQRFVGKFMQTTKGDGLGDIDFDKNYDVADVDKFAAIFFSNDMKFNAAADFNGDGLISLTDVNMFGERLLEVNASQATLAAYNNHFSSIPEPSALLLLSGSVSLIVLRRKRNN